MGNKTIHIRVSDETFDTLVNQCNKSAHDFHSAFEEMLYAWVKAASVLDSYSKIWLLHKDHKRFSNQYNMLREIAMTYLNNPSDELLDQLTALSEEVGLSVEDLLEDVKDNEEMIDYIAKNGTLSETHRAIKDIFDRSQTGALPSSVVTEQVMSAVNCSKETVNRAKRDLGIVSRKTGKAWMWHWPSKEYAEDDIEDLLDDIEVK